MSLKKNFICFFLNKKKIYTLKTQISPRGLILFFGLGGGGLFEGGAYLRGGAYSFTLNFIRAEGAKYFRTTCYKFVLNTP